MEEHANYSIDRFDPLLRDLLWWGLARRHEADTATRGTDDPTGSGPVRWVLSEDAQRRLTELVPDVVKPDRERVLYLDRMCAGCHQRMPTRLTDGIFLCDACRLQRTEATGV